MSEALPLVKQIDAMSEVQSELNDARDEYDDFHSPHEGLGVLWEKMRSLENEVFRKAANPKSMRAEAIQVAAMAVRFAEDLC